MSEGLPLERTGPDFEVVDSSITRGVWGGKRMDVAEEREADDNSHSVLEATALRTLRRQDGD